MEKDDGKIFCELLGLEDNHMIMFESYVVLGYSQVVNVKGYNSYCQREKMGITDIYEKGVNVTNLL